MSDEARIAEIREKAEWTRNNGHWGAMMSMAPDEALWLLDRLEQTELSARTYHRELTEAESRLVEVTKERDDHVAALDSLERTLFGDVWRRSRDEMEARANALAVQLEAAKKSLREIDEGTSGRYSVLIAREALAGFTEEPQRARPDLPPDLGLKPHEVAGFTEETT